MIVAIDGPAGAGKGTLAKQIAQAYGFFCLHTGLLYRHAALCFEKAEGVPLDEGALSDSLNIISYLSISLEELNNPELADEKIARLASCIAPFAGVRNIVKKWAKDLMDQYGEKGLVVEGRDIGTSICPNAQVKIFLEADIQERARRRAFELGQDVEQITEMIRVRDHKDRSRKNSPLQVAPDAILIDTTDLTIEAVFQQVCAVIDTHR